MVKLPKFIAVTGPTGVGKTSFINYVCGSSLAVGASLESCTDTVQVARCQIAGEDVTMIDTPGFDDTHKSQADVLRDIADFLEQTYTNGIKLAGVIYMHRISDYRIGGIARENFRLFTKICGEGAMNNVVIGTTMWEKVAAELGERREKELQSNPIFFKDAVDNGAKMRRILNNAESAREAVLSLLPISAATLILQTQLVDLHRTLPYTDAGMQLQADIRELIAKHERDIQMLRQQLEESMAAADAARQEEKIREIMEGYDKLQIVLQKAKADLQKSLVENLERRRTRRKLRFNFFNLRIVISRRRQGTGCLDGDNFEL
ncbi:P-loop containing nucleoside triphosphate hydrolase protein [Laetiporus sulphureus 93-53]|uniref:p-loop containing nucleoside triphosphate hydrolase protein n=1 Tax=Laetiporus sulphureus 93-53 TaxID=1314785 RepID=A0A165BR41_9APHY|nr:P-loop containing nucleoside triphosphate hydrolase protein [Laetiporus sulphureus 93-53]KZT01501.1 P-loop containing nucleoside triphosphate hydrolase protein [Laetiporus sulphureus 93-53]